MAHPTRLAGRQHHGGDLAPHLDDGWIAANLCQHNTAIAAGLQQQAGDLARADDIVRALNFVDHRHPARVGRRILEAARRMRQSAGDDGR